MSKKLITSFVAFATIVALVVPALPMQAATIMTGDLVKASTACKGFPADAVYLVSGNKLKVFPYLSVYLSWGYSPKFGGVTEVDCSDLDSYTVEGYAKFRDGSAFRGTKQSVKGTYEPRSVYYVEKGKIRPIISCSVYNSLFGVTDCKAHTYWVPDAFISTVNYDEGPMITDTTTLPEGLFVKLPSGKYGIVGAGNTVREFSSTDAIDANRYDTSKAVYTTASLTPGTPITGAEEGLLTVGTQPLKTVPPAGPLTVTLSPYSAPAANISNSTLYNSMLTLRFTAGSTGANITGLTVTKGGISANSAVSGISIWDASGNRHGNIISSLTSDNKAAFLFPANPITVPANGYADVTVKANISATGTSGTLYFSLASLSDVITDGTLSGSTPIVGNTMTLFDGAASIGDLCINALTVGGNTDPSAAANVEIGATEKKVFDISLYQENGLEDMYVDKIVVYVEGNIVENTDVLNWKLYAPDNTLLATATKPVDRYVTFDLANPYKVAKGTTKILSVKVDIADGSTRYFKAHIQNDYDVMFRGASSAVYVAPEANAGAGCTTFADESASDGYFKMKSGDLVVTKNSGSLSGNISQGAEGIVIGKFDLKATGENLEVRKMYVTYTGNSTSTTGNIVIRDTEGNVYASVPASSSNINNDTGYEVTLSSYLNLTTNVVKTIEVVANIAANATGTVKAGLKNFYAKRLSTLDFQYLSPSWSYANELTITAASLVGAKDYSMGNKYVAPGAVNVTIGSFVLSAGTAEDVNVNNITVGFNTSSASSQFVNLALYDGSTQLGSTIATPDDSNNSFSVSLKVPKNGTKTITVKADTVPTGTLSNYVKVTAVSGIGASTSNSITGQYSGADISVSNPIPLQVITLHAATATIAKDTSAPVSQIFIPSSGSYVSMHAIKISANYEALTLNKITFKINATTSTTDANLASCFGSIALYDGATQLGTTSLVFNGSTYDAVFSGLNVSIPADGYKTLVLKGQVSASGTMYPTAVGSWRVKSVNSSDLELRSGSGQVAASNITLTDNGESNYHMYHNTMPVIAVSTDIPTSAQTEKHAGSSTESIFKFTVTASGTRDLRYGTLAVGVYTSGLDADDTITSFKLYDETGTLIDSDNTTLNATTTSATITFTPSTTLSQNAGTTKTFTVKADTSGMTVGSDKTATLYVKIAGASGYSAGDGTNELDWSNGSITYYYTPVGGSENSTAYSGSNSYVVDLDGGTLVY